MRLCFTMRFSLILITALLLPATSFATDYEQGYEDGVRDALNPVCIAVILELCDEKGRIDEDVLYENIENPCAQSSVAYCYRKNQRWANSLEKRNRKLKKRLKKKK